MSSLVQWFCVVVLLIFKSPVPRASLHMRNLLKFIASQLHQCTLLALLVSIECSMFVALPIFMFAVDVVRVCLCVHSVHMRACVSVNVWV